MLPVLRSTASLAVAGQLCLRPRCRQARERSEASLLPRRDPSLPLRVTSSGVLPDTPRRAAGPKKRAGRPCALFGGGSGGFLRLSGIGAILEVPDPKGLEDL
jgi:hypothetical protein